MKSDWFDKSITTKFTKGTKKSYKLNVELFIFFIKFRSLTSHILDILRGLRGLRG